MTRGLLAGAFWGLVVGALVWLAAALVLERRAHGPLVPPEDPVAAVAWPAAGTLATLAAGPAAGGLPELLTVARSRMLLPRPARPALAAPAGRADPPAVPQPPAAALRDAARPGPPGATVALAGTAPEPASDAQTPGDVRPDAGAAPPPPQTRAAAAPPAPSPPVAAAGSADRADDGGTGRAAPELPAAATPDGAARARVAFVVLADADGSEAPAADWALSFAGGAAPPGRERLVPAADGAGWRPASGGGPVLLPGRTATADFLAARREGRAAMLAYDRLATTEGLAARLDALARRARRDGRAAVLVAGDPALQAAIGDWLASPAAHGIAAVPLSALAE